MSWNDYIPQSTYAEYQKSVEDRNHKIVQECIIWNKQNPNNIFYKQPNPIRPNEKDFYEWLRSKK